MKTSDRQTNVQPIEETNAFYEKILQLRATNRKAFDVLSPATHISLFHYEAGRREFLRLQEMKTKANCKEV